MSPADLADLRRQNPKTATTATTALISNNLSFSAK